MAGDLPGSPLDFLESVTAIRGLLHYLLDQREEQLRGERQTLRAIVLAPGKKGRLGQIMHAFTDAAVDDEQLWADIRYLASEYACFDIELPRRLRSGDPSWLNARLKFRESAEPLLRHWLNRETPEAVDLEWHDALERYAEHFERLSILSVRKPELPRGFADYCEFLDCWIRAGKVLNKAKAITWRQLAARCFNGDSKFFESARHQSLLGNLFPALAGKVTDRPVLLHLFLPERIREVLIIENQDSFLYLAKKPPAETALVYGEGYRAGAGRVRERGMAKFSVLNPQTGGDLERFQNWWFAQDMQDWSIRFWGDLDFAGMNIAGSLRSSFSGLECWRTGYEPMIAHLLTGGGHTPDQSDKEGQKLNNFPDSCPYAESVLIPALNRYRRFVDQEWLELPEFE